MALTNLAAWNQKMAGAAASSVCGSACGSGDKVVSTVCGSACGSGDKVMPTACGAGDKETLIK